MNKDTKSFEMDMGDGIQVRLISELKKEDLMEKAIT
jgi:hypothetical protein